MKGAQRRKLIKYRSYPAFAFGALGLYYAFGKTDGEKKAGIILLLIACAIIFFNGLGALSYGKANRILQKGKTRENILKSIPHLERALKLGIAANGEVAVGTIILQHGDMERGKAILEDLLDDPEKKISSSAKVSLSMYWWMKKDYDKAISLCLEAKEEGCTDRNLYINLCTYYFEKKMDKEMAIALKEARDGSKDTPALLDLEAASAIRKNDWNKASRLLNELFSKQNPAFLDPYLHKAMVEMHFGEAEEALSTMALIGKYCLYANTSIYTKEEVESIISLMKEEETRWGVRKIMEEDPEVFFQGKMPSVEKGLLQPEFPSRLVPVEKRYEENTPSVKTPNHRADDDEISTDLTDDDEEWIRRHAND